MANRETSGINLDSTYVLRTAGLLAATPGQQIGEWFGPGRTLNPVAPPDTAGRILDYPVNYNVNIRPRSYENISFDTLRSFADAYDLLRLIIETRKDQIEGYQWEIIPKEGKTASDADVDFVTEFFSYPDKEHPWSTWLRMLLEDLFVIDAVSIYPRATKGGGLYALELMDGSTLKRVIDEFGRTPLPPDPAYQQVLKGLPAINYTREEILYAVRNPRTSRIYGYSPVEQVISTVNIALRRQLHQLQFYTEGNVPEAIAGVPDTWNIQTLRDFQTYWDSVMEGNTAQRRHMKFVPFDASKIVFPKEGALKDQYDEWLARIICFCFSISPSALIHQPNRATAETIQETAVKEGIVPLLNWLKQLINGLITTQLKKPNLQFEWVMQQDLDPLVQAQVDQIYIACKVTTPNEVRERRGDDPLTQKQLDELNPPVPSVPDDKPKPAEVKETQ